jgi:hypothetical protein
VTAQVSPDNAKIGAVQVDYMLAHTNCKLHAAYVYTPRAVRHSGREGCR